MVAFRVFTSILFAVSIFAVASTCASEQTVCAGTGVGNGQATVSIDLGDLGSVAASADLRLGDKLYVGANDCAKYTLPPADSVLPTLVEISRHQQPGPGRGGAHTLDVLYRADAVGQRVIAIACSGDTCPGDRINVTVNVT